MLYDEKQDDRVMGHAPGLWQTEMKLVRVVNGNVRRHFGSFGPHTRMRLSSLVRLVVRAFA